MDSSNNTTNEFIDDITLQFLTNKQSYNKYLSNYDKQKYDERNEFKAKILKYTQKILDITNTYLDSPDSQISSELDEVFEVYMKACIKHIEFKDLEKSNAYNHDKDETDDDNVMFGKIDNDFHSFWGGRVVKKK